MENSTASIQDNAWCQLNHQCLEKIIFQHMWNIKCECSKIRHNSIMDISVLVLYFQIFLDFKISCNILFFQAWRVILRSLLIIIVFVICHCDSVIPLGCRRKSDFSNLTQAFKLHANWTIHLSKCLVHFESVSFS